jgi:hypothetical protein
MPKINDIIDKLVLNPITIDMTYKYKNTVELSGWIIRKPKFIKHDKTGVESCSLLLFQINNKNGEIKLESFNCMVYVKELIEQLKVQDKVLFVATIGKVRHHYKYGDYSQIVEMQTLAELDLPLANEWGKD